MHACVPVHCCMFCSVVPNENTLVSCHPQRFCTDTFHYLKDGIFACRILLRPDDRNVTKVESLLPILEDATKDNEITLLPEIRGMIGEFAGTQTKVRWYTGGFWQDSLGTGDENLWYTWKEKNAQVFFPRLPRAAHDQHKIGKSFRRDSFGPDNNWVVIFERESKNDEGANWTFEFVYSNALGVIHKDESDVSKALSKDALSEKHVVITLADDRLLSRYTVVEMNLFDIALLGDVPNSQINVTTLKKDDRTEYGQSVELKVDISRFQAWIASIGVTCDKEGSRVRVWKVDKKDGRVKLIYY